MILKIENGAFGYGKSPIFKHINLDISAGEVFCILGPNGVGKTSLLKCLSGLLPLSYGRVLCRGKDIQQISPPQMARSIAYVPQMHSPVFAYTVLEAVLMGRTPYLGFFSFPDPEDCTIAEKAIETVGISHLAHKAYTQISGGERQLVMIARALAQEPDLIILDEPCSHLDYGNQIKVLSLIRRLAREKGTAVAMTSHNPDHGFMVADRVGIMFNQTILKSGCPQTTITEETLSQIYGIKVQLKPDPVFGNICVPHLIQEK